MKLGANRFCSAATTWRPPSNTRRCPATTASSSPRSTDERTPGASPMARDRAGNQAALVAQTYRPECWRWSSPRRIPGKMEPRSRRPARLVDPDRQLRSRRQDRRRREPAAVDRFARASGRQGGAIRRHALRRRRTSARSIYNTPTTLKAPEAITAPASAWTCDPSTSTRRGKPGRGDRRRSIARQARPHPRLQGRQQGPGSPEIRRTGAATSTCRLHPRAARERLHRPGRSSRK